MPVTPPELGLSNLAMQTSNSRTAQALTSVKRVTANGYCGTLRWDTNVTNGPYYYTVCYQVDYRNPTTGAWQLYDTAYIHTSDANGAHSHALDFFAQVAGGVVKLPAESTFNIRAWVSKYEPVAPYQVVGVIGGSAALWMFHKYIYGFVDNPLAPAPNPGPYPGDDPPIDHPELGSPDYGPVGPGALQSW